MFAGRTRVFWPVAFLIVSVVVALNVAGCGNGTGTDGGTGGASGNELSFVDDGGRKFRIRIEGDLQDGKVKRLAGLPLSIRVRRADGRPVKGMRVLFQSISLQGARLIHGNRSGRRIYVETDASGKATITFRFGSHLGVYKIEAVVFALKRSGEYFRYEFRLTGLDYMKLLFGLFGGLGLFLFGMKMMTDHLQQLAGDRLESLLEVLTRKRIVGLGVGALVTAVIQSSSATTVMLVGFLNAGLMKLEQAIPIIFGANIGTTITGQMMSFKLGKFALPAIGVAFLLIMFSSRKKYRLAGHVLMGFGLLFMGMNIMSGVFKPLRSSPMVSGAFTSFGSNPLYGFLAGLVATVTLQSSSATVGLAITLAGSGLLDFSAAVPIIFGDNVGTTVTAVLASLTANLAARRAAFVHMCFNLFGSFIMLAGLGFTDAAGHPYYYVLVDRLTSGDVFAGENVARHVANAHSIFNILFAFAFLPMSGLFARLASLVLRSSDGTRVTRLEEHLVKTPDIAIQMVVSEMDEMARIARSMLTDAMSGFMKRDDRYFVTVPEREEMVDDMQAAITNYLVRLSQEPMGAAAAAQIPRLLHSVNDIERIADISENIVELGERVISRRLPFSEQAEKELLTLYGRVLEMMDRVLLGIDTGDREQCRLARHVEKDVDHLEDSYRRNHIRRLKDGTCDPVSGVVFLEVIGHLEKIGDHLDNVAQAFSSDD